MTIINQHVPAQHSAFNSIVVNLFTSAVILATGFLTFAVFASV
jgi:hypothetical protein